MSIYSSSFRSPGVTADEAEGIYIYIYRPIVLPTLLCACETWTVYQRHARKLNHFHTTCLRKLLNIQWQDRILDTRGSGAGLSSIYTILVQSQLRWSGHVVRMPDQRLPQKTVLLRAIARKAFPRSPKQTL